MFMSYNRRFKFRWCLFAVTLAVLSIVMHDVQKMVVLLLYKARVDTITTLA
jgi:hypothetical protein